jgi:hypothetical protein
MKIEINGLNDTEDDISRIEDEIGGAPMLRIMRDAAMLVTRDAKMLVPVDIGRLRASITPEVRQMGRTFNGVVGSTVVYAKAIEEGTKPHWPPWGELANWARRHGWTEAGIRHVIGTRGTRPHPYLVPALENNTDAIVRLFARGIEQIIGR